jgi:hypothetical protein
MPGTTGSPGSASDELPPPVLTAAGADLPVRLVRTMRRSRELGVTGVLTVVWTGSVLAAGIGMRSRFPVAGVALIACAILLGALIAVSLLKRVLVAPVSEPVLELDAHPLRPGAVHTLSVAQRGPLTLGHLAVELRGVESVATLKTTTRRVFTTVFNAKLLDEEPTLEAGELWKRRIEVRVPGELRPSFAGPDRGLDYFVVVQATGMNHPEPEENSYPVLVSRP